MLRKLLASALFVGAAAALAGACGGKTTLGTSASSSSSSTTSSSTTSSSTTSSSTSSSSSTTSSSGGPCAPGSTMPCICHQGGTQGTQTCNPDGTWGACLGACACDPGRSDGCCSGDGICCPCVVGCNPAHVDPHDPATNALIACVCSPGVCDQECATECAGNGIGMTCGACVQKAGMGVCKAQYQACGGQ